MKYFIVAGEASGDLHASHLMASLKMKDPAAEFAFFGGDLMQAQGGRLLKHYREMAFMGFVAVLKNIRKISRNLRFCKSSILEFQPDVVILIDYPGFNLRIAEFVHQNTAIPVYYYISPKVWVWKEYRVKSIRKYVDKMFTIFPFETEFYQKHQYPVEYVGNPTLDGIAKYREDKKRNMDKNPGLLKDHSGNFHIEKMEDDFRRKNRLSDKKIIALLPGSRMQEIKACLPMMIRVASKYNDYQIVVAGAPGVERDAYETLGVDKSIPVVFEQTYQLVENASAAIVNSGTATLETALLKTPQVVVYYLMMGRIASMVKGILLKTKYISLVNIIGGREIVRELYGHLFTEKNLNEELNLLLKDDAYRKEMSRGYAEVALKLGEPGAAEHCASKMIEFITSRQVQ